MRFNKLESMRFNELEMSKFCSNVVFTVYYHRDCVMRYNQNWLDFSSFTDIVLKTVMWFSDFLLLQ